MTLSGTLVPSSDYSATAAGLFAGIELPVESSSGRSGQNLALVPAGKLASIEER